MKETIKGFVVRDRINGPDWSRFHAIQPYFNTMNGKFAEIGQVWGLRKHHGLKPGQIKKAKITVEVE